MLNFWDNLSQFNKSIIIIENHDFFIKNKIKIDTFFKLLRENFHLEVLHDCERNPHNIIEIQEYKDDDKWLMVSEGRICKQDWLICIPKSRFLKTIGVWLVLNIVIILFYYEIRQKKNS